MSEEERITYISMNDFPAEKVKKVNQKYLPE